MQPSLDASWSDNSAHRSGFVIANAFDCTTSIWGGAGPVLILIHGFLREPALLR